MRGTSLASLIILVSLTAFMQGFEKAASDDPAAVADERELRTASVPTDGPKLLEYLKTRFTRTISDEKIKALIEQLGDDSFEKREEASRLLVDVGLKAKKFLQDALRHPDLEIRQRSRDCLRLMDRDLASGQLLGTAIRVLARKKPEGSTKLLLEQLPALSAEPVGDIMRDALVPLAIKDGKADESLLAALKDPDVIRRAAAAQALSRARAVDALPALKKLLTDPERTVRLPLALQLVKMKDKDAITVLIAEMDQPLSALHGESEQLLITLAGEKSPYLKSDTEASRKAFRKSWEEWWKEAEAKLDWSVLEEREKRLGRTMVVLLDDGLIVDLDEKNKERWRLSGLRMILDVQPLPEDKALLAEYEANRITERNSKNEVVWKHEFAEPLTAQRLPNGHTFMANAEVLVQIDKTGKEVFRWSPIAGQKIMRARKLLNGDILLITQLGGPAQFVRLDRFGKQIRRFGVEVGTSGGRLDVTSTGNVLIPEMYNNRVCEYDSEGKHVRSIAVQQPIAVTALPNGNLLVTSMTERRAIELDKTGKEVWEYKREGSTTRVSRAIRY